MDKLRIKKTNIAKQKTWAKSMDWSLAEPFMDLDMDISTRNRQSEFLTFRQFKELVESGKSAKDISLLGYSRHQISFMTSFLRGKVQISKEKFIEEYREKGLSLTYISEKYSISRENMSFLRALYQIKATGPTYQDRKLKELPLSKRQRQIIIGGLLGDAGKASRNSVKFKHGEAQKEYLLWKFDELSNISSKNSVCFRPFTTRTGKDGMSCMFYTKSNSQIEDIIKQFYPEGKKIIPKDLLEELDPLGLAVWFMDDGKGDLSLKKNGGTIYDLSLCTDLFSWEDCKYIIDWFKRKHEIDCTLHTSHKGNPRIRFPISTVEKFIELIEPYFVPCMKYKINIKEQLKRKSTNKTSKNSYSKSLKKCRSIAMNSPIGKDFIKMLPLEQDSLTEKIVTAYIQSGFDVLLTRTEETTEDGEALLHVDTKDFIDNDVFVFSKIGHKFCSSHFPDFFTARAKGKKSPLEVFENRRYLSEIIRELLVSGKTPLPHRVLSMTKSYRGNKAVSSFMPVVAKSIYDKYCRYESKVLDFCSGYGARLAGAMASKKVKAYHGIEPDKGSYKGLLSLKHSFNKYLNISKDVTIKRQRSTLGTSTYEDDFFDLCFTSVPYFDAEEYSEDPVQSYIQYPKYGEWFQSFLIESVKEALRVSKLVLINVNNTGAYAIADHFREWLKENELYSGEDRLELPKYGGGKKYEPIFVIKKGNAP